MSEQVEIKPQPGPQTDFLSSAADVVIYGGAAGGGKSWGLLLEPIRHIKKPGFGTVIFRREREQITNEGGLWDEARKTYSAFPARVNNSDLYYKFPSGSTIGFAGLNLERDVLKWQGSQIALLGFDELTHFTEYQFFYMLSRNRTTSGVRSYVRATTNPDAESWVAGFIEYWIDQTTGQPIPERAGRIRYLVRHNDRNNWFDEKAAAEDFVRDTFPDLVDALDGQAEHFVKSVTFIPADVFDNQKLLSKDPAYLANLLSLPLIERERLLKGNWKIKATAGKVYNREWFELVESVAVGGLDVRFWDFAGTAKQLKTTSTKDPDYTATVKLRYKNDTWTIIDSFQIQAAPANVEKLFLQTAALDVRESKANGTSYRLRWEIEPGSAAVRENARLVRKLAGIDAKGIPSRADKLTRARACSVQAEHGNVKMLKAAWNSELLTYLHGFPDLAHDDLVDALSGAFNESVNSNIILTK